MYINTLKPLEAETKWDQLLGQPSKIFVFLMSMISYVNYVFLIHDSNKNHYYHSGEKTVHWYAQKH